MSDDQDPPRIRFSVVPGAGGASRREKAAGTAQISPVPGSPDMVRLVLDRVVTLRQAATVMAIVNGDGDDAA